MEKLNIVIIGQWIYPLSIPRSNRTWQLALQMAKMGHNVDLYALIGNFDYKSIVPPNLHVHNLGESHLGLLNSSGYYKRTFFNRAIGKIIGDQNIYPGIEFYPMISRLFKQSQKIDLLITIAFPHVIHWATSACIDKNKVKCWVADCGDPFAGNPCIKVPFYASYFEKKWCNIVDYITIPIEEGRGAYFPEYRSKIRVIPQGFSFSDLRISDYNKNDIPTCACCGTIYKGVRDPSAFFDYLCKSTVKIKVVIYSNDPFFIPYRDARPDIFEIRERVAHHELIFELSKMDFLLNFTNTTTLQQPSKLIDFALAKRPILSITTNFSPKEEKVFLEFLEGNYSNQTTVDNLEQFDIRKVATQFLELYNNNRDENN